MGTRTGAASLNTKNLDPTLSSELEQCLSPLNKNQAQLPKSLSPKIELRLRLLPKLAEMRLKKWITSEEESEYLKVLTTMGSDDNEATEKVYRKLKQIERKHQERKQNVDLIRHRTNPEIAKRSTPKRALSRKRTYQGPKDERNQNSDKGGARFSYEPKLLNPESCKELRISSTDLQDLFVEMCFYARLRLKQAPCCLYCSYRKVKRSQSSYSGEQGSNVLCNRLVLWRKDATRPLGKNNLDGSLVILHCQDAQSLLKGGALSSGDAEWKWDNGLGQLLIRKNRWQFTS